jgi:hypothetical protein
LVQFIRNSVLQEFRDVDGKEILNILQQYYKVHDSMKHLETLMDDDAKKKFVNRPELICRIIRKHYGLPEQPNLKLYPEEQIDAEINHRIGDMVKRRENLQPSKKSEIHIRRKILKSSLIIPKTLTKKQLETEIQKRCILTGLTPDVLERQLYMAYFNIGIK